MYEEIRDLVVGGFRILTSRSGTNNYNIEGIIIISLD